MFNFQRVYSNKLSTKSKINFCLTANKESKIYLKKLGAKKINFIGNLKYSQSESEKLFLDKNVKNFIKSKTTWCASSTHHTEEKFCGKIHIELKKKYKNLLTIIIPRHVDRTKEIYDKLKLLNLKTVIRSSKQKIVNNTDIYLVDSYGETKKFFKIAKTIFMGGSIANHGGQNPIEPARYNLNIVHGPNIGNFKDIYGLFNRKKLAFKIKNQNQLNNILQKLLNKKTKKNLDLKKIGESILKKSVIEINKILNNEIKKT